uniref:Uncharacterized protein n=1 Tax=Eutreptiella gymnastica TaxID=73025 RepID=A0A7S1IJT2_9EUGL
MHPSSSAPVCSVVVDRSHGRTGFPLGPPQKEAHSPTETLGAHQRSTSLVRSGSELGWPIESAPQAGAHTDGPGQCCKKPKARDPSVIRKGCPLRCTVPCPPEKYAAVRNNLRGRRMISGPAALLVISGAPEASSSPSQNLRPYPSPPRIQHPLRLMVVHRAPAAPWGGGSGGLGVGLAD